MKRKLYRIFVYVSLALINLFVKINSPKICALIIYLNIRKLKIIKSNTKNPKKVLVFPKSNGTEDIIESFKNKKSNKNEKVNNFNHLWLATHKGHTDQPNRQTTTP